MANGTVGLTGAAFAHGLTVLAFIYAFGHLSGTHINPAVTAAILAAKRIDLPTAAGYWVAQLTGGVLAGFALRYVFSDLPGGSFTWAYWSASR